MVTEDSGQANDILVMYCYKALLKHTKINLVDIAAFNYRVVCNVQFQINSCGGSLIKGLNSLLQL